MKRIYLLLFLGIAGIFTTVNAQDFLVTINRDTINCKLGTLKDGEYPIAFYLDEERYEGTIHKDSILFFKKNVFRSLNNNRLKPWYPHVELQFDGGIMRHFGPFRYDFDLTDQGKGAAQTGFITGAGLTYYVNELIGYGIKYSYRQHLEGDIKYQYIGPMLNFRFWGNSRKNHVFLSFSGGFAWMRQKDAPIQLELIRPRIEMTAKSFVGDIGIGYKMKLTKNISAHAKLSGMLGYPGFIRVEDINKITVASDKPLEIGNYCHNMNSINFTVGFSFHN